MNGPRPRAAAVANITKRGSQAASAFRGEDTLCLRVGEPTPVLGVTRLKRLWVHTPDRQPIEQQIIDKTEGMERDHYVERLTKHIKFLQVGQIKPWFNTMIHGSIHDKTAKTRREASCPWGRTATRAENLLNLGSNIRNLTFYSV